MCKHLFWTGLWRWEPRRGEDWVRGPERRRVAQVQGQGTGLEACGVGSSFSMSRPSAAIYTLRAKSKSSPLLASPHSTPRWERDVGGGRLGLSRNSLQAAGSGTDSPCSGLFRGSGPPTAGGTQSQHSRRSLPGSERCGQRHRPPGTQSCPRLLRSARSAWEQRQTAEASPGSSTGPASAPGAHQLGNGA